MSAIERIQARIKADGLQPGSEVYVGRRTAMKIQWELFDLSPLTGDVAWLRANRPDFEHDNITINGVRLRWES